MKHHSNRRTLGFISLAAAMALCGVAAGTARATNYVWLATGPNADWNAVDYNSILRGYNTNWGTLTTSAVFPASGSGTSLEFTDYGSGTTTNNLANPFILNSLSFDSNANAFTIAGNALEFAANGSTAPSINQNSSNNQTVQAALTLDANLNLNVNGAGFLLLLGQISGASSGIYDNGSGFVEFTGGTAASPSAFSFLHVAGGSTEIDGGVVNLSSTGSTGFGGESSLFVDANASLTIASGAQVTTYGTPQVHNNGTIFVQGAGTVWTNDDAPSGGPAADIRIGYAGGTSQLVVENGAEVSSQGNLTMGNSSFSANPGVGSVIVDQGSLSVGRSLILDTTSSLTVINGTVTAGALSSVAGSAPTISLGDPTGGVALTVGSANTDATFAGVISDYAPPGISDVLSGSFEKVGTGTLTLTGSNTYSGNTIVNGGTLLLANPNGSAIAGDLVVNAGGTVRLADNTQLAVDTVNSIARGVTLNGGTLDLGAYDQSVDHLDINDGSQVLGTGNGLGLYNPNITAIDATGASTINSRVFLNPGTSPAGDRTIDTEAGATLTINGQIWDGGGGSGSFIKTGPGTLVLAGTAPNTYTGQTTVQDGELDLDKVGSIGGNLTITGGALVFNADAMSSSGTLNIDGGLVEVIPAITLGQLVFTSGGLSSYGQGYFLTSTSQYAMEIVPEVIFSDNVHLTSASGGGISFDNGGSLGGAVDLGGIMREINAGGDLTVSAILSNGGMQKTGSGTATFTSGTGASPMTLQTFLVGEAGTVGGDTVFDGGAMTLTDTGSTGFGGESSLFIEGGNTLTVQDGFTLNTIDTPQLHNTAQMIVDGDGTTWTNTANGSDFAQIRIGYAGGTSILTVQNKATVSTPNMLISHPQFTADPGVGSLIITTGGKVNITGQLLLGDGASISVDKGTLTTDLLEDSYVNGGTSSIALTDPVGSSALVLDGGSYSGAITDGPDGPGGITLNGPFNMYLEDATYSGPTIVNGGYLEIDYQTHAGAFTVNGGELEVNDATQNPGLNSLTAASGATIEYLYSTVNGGFLKGTGMQEIVGAQLNGSTIEPGANIQISGATFTNVTSSANITMIADLTWDGGLQTAAGTLNVQSDTSVDQFENDGIIHVYNGAWLTNSETNLVNGAGASVQVDQYGVIELQSTGLDLRGASLINDGVIAGGPTNIYFNSLAKGSGRFASINLYSGGTFSPGDGPGAVTSGDVSWSGGGSYLFEMTNAAGVSGVDWDVWHIIGDLNLAGTQADPMYVDFQPLNVANFNINDDYEWLIADVTGTISGFEPSDFVVENPTGLARYDGFYDVVENGNALYLVYDPINVPEPAVPAMLSLALIGLAPRRRK